MVRRQLVVLAVVGALVTLAPGGPAVASPDPAYPTASFEVPHPRQWVVDQDGERPQVAFVPVRRLSLADDATPAKDLVVKVYPDAGAPAQQWFFTETEMRLVYSGGSIDSPDPWVDLAGTHHPYVTVTDGDGHTTRVDLPAVTLVEDHTAPVTRLRLPRPGLRHTIKGWRIIRGTVTDAGIDSPTSSVGSRSSATVIVMQRRHGRFYVYNQYTRRWRRGLPTEAATYRKLRPVGGDAVNVGRTGWRTRWIHGLTRGRLVVRVSGVDFDLNRTPDRVLARSTLTRRR